jgi:hypothetical protein
MRSGWAAGTLENISPSRCSFDGRSGKEASALLEH